jgi:predicted membrane GTPase involved in stress response
MWNVGGRGEVHARFWWENLRKRDHFEDVCGCGRIILKYISKKWDGKMGWIDLA